MKNSLLLWFLMALTYVTQAQTLTIIDKDSKKPLEGVVLISEKPRASVISNSKGQVELSALANAEEIHLRILGYKTLKLDFNALKEMNFQIGMEQAIMNLEQVVVSATRWQQNSGEIPAKIISIFPKEVALQNPQTAADLLGISGKVFIQKSQQGGGSPMIRGFATNRLVYTVDGVRMNNAIFRGGNIQNVISLDPYATENTEVIFGPGSVIYGSDAIGGVMSFQTLTPQLSLSDSLLVKGKGASRFSTANQEKSGHFDVNLGWKKWASVTSLSVWDYDDLRQGKNGPDDYLKSVYVEREDTVDKVITQDDPLLQIPSAYSQFNMMQKIRFKPNEHWDFQYGFHLSSTTPYGRYDRHNRFRNDLPRYAEWKYGSQKWMMNNLSISHQGDFKAYDQLNIRLAQQSFEESRIDRTLNKTDQNRNTENVEAYSINLDMVKSIGDRHELFYGLEYILNDVRSIGSIRDINTEVEIAGPSRYPNSTWTSIGAYVNDEYKLAKKMTLQMGLRYNQFIIESDFSNNQNYYPFQFNTASLNKGALTGSLGAVYRPSEKWIFRTNLGTAFRAPNVDDMGKIFDSEPGSVTIPNPSLNAEYAYNADFGIAKVFGDFLKLDATAYYTILQNAMVRRDYVLNGQDSIIYDGVLSKVQALQNAAVANVYGIQAGLECKLPAGFTILSDINYQIGEEELDDGTKSASRQAAPLFGVSRLRYKYNGLTLEFNSIYQGMRKAEDLAVEEQAKDEIYAKDENGKNYSPSWYTLNFKSNFEINETFTLGAGIENITDQRYRPYSSGISGAGLNFILSLNAFF